MQFRPEYAEAYSNLGNALNELDRHDEALAACVKAIQLKPAYAEAHNNMGNALRDQGKLQDATAAYARAIQLRPGFAEAYSNLWVRALFEAPGKRG